MRKNIKALIDADSSVLDIGCGTGALVFSLSSQSTQVIGLDLNAEILKFCDIKRKKLGIENVEFVEKDASESIFLHEYAFDYAVLSMVLHQFSQAEANQVLCSVRKSVRNIIMADFNIPLPKNGFGWGAEMIERIAGGDHYAHFKEYRKAGGLDYFLDFHQLDIIDSQNSGLGVIRIIKTMPRNSLSPAIHQSADQ